MARRSARLSSRNSSTPQPVKRVSLSHDAFVRAPRTVPSKLSSLVEGDEMPGSFPESPTTSMLEQPSKRQRTAPATPQHTSPIVPSKEEMHPQATHQSTVKAHEEARWLGFSAMSSTTKVPLKPAADGCSTPTKRNTMQTSVQSPDFKFTFTREQSLELSPAAKTLMQATRAEAARIKEQMKSSGEAEDSITASMSRKIATPKSQKSRFSDVHNAQFQKMDSIAGHASAFRKSPHRAQSMIPATKSTTDSPVSSLKRSPSKSALPSLITTPSKAPASTLKRKAEDQLTQAVSEQANAANGNDDTASARKRAKHAETASSATQTNAAGKFDHLTTPTKSSLARSGSVKSVRDSKIPAPSVQTPSKQAPSTSTVAKQATPYLSKTPLKAPAGSIVSHTTASAQKSTLLSRTPIKSSSSLFSGTAETLKTTPNATKHQQLARSPLRSCLYGADNDQTMSSNQSHPTDHTAQEVHADNPFEVKTPLTGAAKANTSSLLGRFNRLRASPIKSILRTPQRLYSNDPVKVAAGTHLATPPQMKGQIGRQAPATAPVNKRVDFSSSTKAREADKAASLSPFTFAPPQKATSHAGVTPDQITYPSLDDFKPVESFSVQKRRQSSGPGDFTFRAGSDIVFAPSSTPTKSNTTPRTASAYTIRYVAPEPETEQKPEIKANDAKQRKIRFENTQSAAQTNTSPTVTLGSKKRKFDFENEIAEQEAGDGGHFDKENMPVASTDDNDRPTKRLKASASPGISRPSTTSAITKRTTPGVKTKSAGAKSPEKVQKRPGNKISLARLNALAMPKKRN